MNLVQITEQLKNPAISVPQLMQYANNSNPQVPSYVALAEMQRRQSMQAPPQAPQQTVKDQLGSQLMGLPSVAPQQEQQSQQQPQQPPQQPPEQPPQQQIQQPEQPPMPEPKPALPAQPGMAGGGLTSIPLNMHHDFAAGGIIAFADGGYPAGYEIPEKMTEEDARAEREKAKQTYGFGGDPYAEAKRRYAEIEAKQKEGEKGAGFDKVISSLAAMGAGGPRQFGDVMSSYANTSLGIEKTQRKEAEQNAMKMAELHSLWGKEQDALKRSEYEAVMGRVDKSRAAQAEALTARRQFDQVQASTTQAEAAAQNARTLEEQRKFEQSKYPDKLKIEQDQARAALISAGRNPELQVAERVLADMRKTNPNATLLDAMTAMQTGKFAGKAALTQDQMLDAWEKMKLDERMERKKRAGGDLLKAQQDYFNEIRGGLAGLPTGRTGGTGPASKLSDAEIKAQLGIK